MALFKEEIVKSDIERAFNKKPVSETLQVNPPKHGGTENFPNFVFSVDKISRLVYITVGGTKSIAEGGKWHIEIWVREETWKSKSESIKKVLEENSTADLEYILTGKPNEPSYVVFARKEFEKANTKNIENDAFGELLKLIGFIKKVAKSLVEKT
ncbi:MAG TPA: hypothetical protein PK239_15065 [Chitinophagales bacterium]|nr:hypothetical protein [Chitinophagales bacterium]